MVVCPECGTEVPKGAEEKHGITHWGVPYSKLYQLKNPDAVQRYKVLMGDEKPKTPIIKPKEE